MSRTPLIRGWYDPYSLLFSSNSSPFSLLLPLFLRSTRTRSLSLSPSYNVSTFSPCFSFCNFGPLIFDSNNVHDNGGIPNLHSTLKIQSIICSVFHEFVSLCRIYSKFAPSCSLNRTCNPKKIFDQGNRTCLTMQNSTRVWTGIPDKGRPRIAISCTQRVCLIVKTWGYVDFMKHCVCLLSLLHCKMQKC